MFGHFDADLERPVAEKPHLVHIGQLHQFVTHVLCDRLARNRIHVAIDGDEAHGERDLLLADDRLLCERRERRYRIDAGLDLAEDLVEIRIARHLGSHGTDTF